MKKSPPPVTGRTAPALALWRDECARGARDPHDRDWLHRVAALEADAEIFAAIGCPQAAAASHTTAARIVAAVRKCL